MSQFLVVSACDCFNIGYFLGFIFRIEVLISKVDFFGKACIIFIFLNVVLLRLQLILGLVHHLPVQALGLVESALNPRLLAAGGSVTLDIILCSLFLRAVDVVILIEVVIDSIHLPLATAGLASFSFAGLTDRTSCYTASFVTCPLQLFQILS